MLDDHGAQVVGNDKLDPPARAVACREAAHAARHGAAEWKADDRNDALKTSRDKAFAHADEAVREVWTAGRYAFRKEPGSVVDYRDGYSVSKARKARRRAAAAVTELEPA